MCQLMTPAPGVAVPLLATMLETHDMSIPVRVSVTSMFSTLTPSPTLVTVTLYWIWSPGFTVEPLTGLLDLVTIQLLGTALLVTSQVMCSPSPMLNWSEALTGTGLSCASVQVQPAASITYVDGPSSSRV